jgi:hypothetical protein
MKNLYVAVYHHEFGVDTWVFCYEPKGKRQHPSPRKVAEHFNINFEPHLGETLELIAVNGQKIETVTAAQVGTTEPPTIDWVDREGWDSGRDEG